MNIVKLLMSQIGSIGQRLKYGFERRAEGVSVQMAASQALAFANARFVTLNSAGQAALTADTDTTLFGFIEAAGFTPAVGDVLKANTSPDAIFRIPVVQAATAGAAAANWLAIMGKIDLDILSGQGQGLDADVTTRGHVIIVGQDAWISSVATYGTNNVTPNAATGCRWVDVKMNAAILGK
jgi:hypothetical protein